MSSSSSSTIEGEDSNRLMRPLVEAFENQLPKLSGLLQRVASTFYSGIQRSSSWINPEGGHSLIARPLPL